MSLRDVSFIVWKNAESVLGETNIQVKQQPYFKVNELVGIMRPVPITDGAIEARMPIKGEEEHGTIVVVSEDVNDGVNHTAEDEGQPPMSARADLVHEAPEQDGVEDECCGRVQEVVRGNPPGIVEIGVVDDIFHHAAGVLLKNKTIIRQRSPRKQAERQVGCNRSPQECRFSEFVLCAEFLFDGGVDDQVGGDGVQDCFLL